MKVIVTYKQISEDLQKAKTENIYKILANAIKRKSDNQTKGLHYKKDDILWN